MNEEFRLSDEDRQALRADQQLQERATAAQDAAIEASETPELPQGEASTQAPTEAKNDVTKPEKSLQDKALQAAGGLIPGSNVLTGVLDKGMEYAQANGLLPSEGVAGEVVDAMQGDPLEAPAKGLADFGVNTYNFLMPGEQFDVKRQTDGMLAPYDNKVKQTIRDVSSFLLPELLGLRGASLKMAGTRLPGMLGKLQKAKSVQYLSKMVGGTAMGIGIQDINLDPYGDLDENKQEGMNATGALKANWPMTWRMLPDGLATKYDDTPDEKRAKNRYEAMVFMGFEPLVSAASRMVLNAGSLFKGLKYVPEVENAKQVADKLNKGNELLTDDLAMDKLLKHTDLAEKNLDDYGAYMLSKMQELDKPIKGVHTNFDVTELGTRSRDADGALGAMNDAYRIANNVDTYNGRLGSMYTSAAAKHGMELENVKKGWLVNQVVREVRDAAKISTRLQSGKKITSRQRDKAVIEMWKAMTDINADSSMILDFATKMARMPGRDEAIDRSIRTYRDQYLNLDKFKAQALLETSTAGQISDMSYAGSKAFDKVGTEQLQDELMDRLKVLMTMKMMGQMDQAEILADAPMLKRWLMQGDEAAVKDITVAQRRRGLTREQRVEENYRKVTKFIDTLNAIRAEKPHWMKPLMQMWEATDGRVDSMYKLNAAIENSLGRLNKALYDPNPEFPQLLLQEMQATLYNSTLGAVKTAINMTLGTAQGQLDHIFSPYIGSLASGDWDGIVKHSAALAAQFQHAGASIKVGSDRFVQLWKDPDAAVAALKPDFAFKQSKIMDALESAGEAARLDGNDGIAMALLQREQIHALATDPLFRLVPNIGGAADAVSHDGIAWYQAHRQAYEKFFAKRAEAGIRQLTHPFGKKRLKAMERQIYRSMYDGDVLREPVAKLQSAEISLTKDNFLGDAMNAITKRVPPLKQAFMFPRMLGAAAEASVNFTAIPLMQKLGGFARRADQMSVDEMREVLTSKGMQNIPDSQVYSTYKQMRMKTRGRALLGSAFVTAGFMMAISDRLHGNGHYDRNIQKARGKGWQRSSFLGTDGKWYSHKALGPFSTLLDLIADTQDNFSTLGESPMENLGVKLAFILGGVVDDVNLAAGLVPFLDILQGKPTAMERLAANTVNSAMPIAGHRREWSAALDPQVEEVSRDFGGYLRAQNGWLDVLSPETGLPENVDIMGNKIGTQASIMDRMFNAFSPIKIGAQQTPEALALIKYEYPVQIPLSTLDGIDLNGVQQEELATLVFSDPSWQRSVRRILRKYKDYDFEGKRQEVVAGGNAGTESPISKFYGLHAELDEALNNVKERVKFQMKDYDYIKVQAYWQQRNQEAAARGEGPVKTEAELYIESMNP